ncbi:MAG: hypothetical protein H6726_25330 [Sandaracinaceae bacterium]|nr:hypothetical protein [Sandaracinaceae bacterium]
MSRLPHFTWHVGRRARSRILGLAVTLASVVDLAGCVDQAPVASYGDPTQLDAVTTQSGISARVIAPTVGDVQREPHVRLSLAAYTDPPVALTVRLTDALGGVLLATPTGEPGPEQRFVAELPLLHGDNRVEVRIAEVDGLRNRRFELVARYEGDAPGLRFAFFDDRSGAACGSPVPAGVTGRESICVRGRVSRGAAPLASPQQVTLGTDANATTVTADEAGDFEGVLPLPAEVTQAVTVSVTDSAARTTRATRDVVRDTTPPALSAPLAETSPNRTNESHATFTGTVADEHGVEHLEIINGGGGVVDVLVAPTFRHQVRLQPGENPFTLRATDSVGNASELSVVIIRDRLIRLGPPDASGHAVLQLDRAGLEAVMTESAQRTTDVVTISLRTPVVQALYRIRDPERFGVDTSAWGQGERNLQRLLRMTPDTADLSGSSIEELLAIAPSVGLPAPRILANLVSLAPTDTFVDIERVADAVLDLLIGTHGNIDFDASTGDPALTLTMHDVLNDLRPVAARYGPRDGHPGFLTGESFASVFEPGFQMSIPARSNLSPYQGVDAAREGKSYLFRLEGDENLELDFLSDDFAVVGMVDEPLVDLRFALSESPVFVGVSSTRGARPDPQHAGFARGDGGAFAASPWHLEHIVAEAAYRQFQPLYGDTSYARTFRYDAGAIADAAVIDWDRGWVSIATSGNLGSPPAPTYFWDVLTEIAQLRLHDGGIAEGQASMDFLLRDLPVGLDAEGLIAALRPTLQAQASELAALLIGADRRIESAVDVYFVPATDGGPGFLFFRAPEDAAGTYAYASPGFFSDASLSTRVSSSAARAGTDDTTHEKLVPVAGQTVYFADDAGTVFALEVVTVDATGVSLRVVPQTRSAP